MNKAEIDFLYTANGRSGGKPVGRKLTAQESRWHRLKQNGATDQTIATILNVSLQQINNLKNTSKVKGYIL